MVFWGSGMTDIDVGYTRENQQYNVIPIDLVTQSILTSNAIFFNLLNLSPGVNRPDFLNNTSAMSIVEIM